MDTAGIEPAQDLRHGISVRSRFQLGTHPKLGKDGVAGFCAISNLEIDEVPLLVRAYYCICTTGT